MSGRRTPDSEIEHLRPQASVGSAAKESVHVIALGRCRFRPRPQEIDGHTVVEANRTAARRIRLGLFLNECTHTRVRIPLSQF